MGSACTFSVGQRVRWRDWLHRQAGDVPGRNQKGTVIAVDDRGVVVRWDDGEETEVGDLVSELDALRP